MLEERVSMLEQSGAEMAEALVTKTKLIQNYCMEKKGSYTNKSTPSTPSHDKMRSFVDKIDKFVNLDGHKESHKQEVGFKRFNYEKLNFFF